MNLKKVDELIPVAIQLLEDPEDDFKNIKTTENKISSKYVGYIASFGPSVIQAGMAKTLAFYKKSGTADRSVITNFIKHVLIKGNSDLKLDKNKDLLTLYLENTNNQPTLKRLNFRDKILEAALACKLAMFTYETKEEEQ
ncbi:type III-B CRISPR module-associated protein Cmr5 [Rosettibacter firmus]|uniref:type III-B CRISPR module-associated protein Cmr5 n=1 Tax=Rosettibacter firmus TaxID=3111522 RepID=UPI00336C1BEF